VSPSSRMCSIMLRGRSWWRTMRKVDRILERFLASFLQSAPAAGGSELTRRLRDDWVISVGLHHVDGQGESLGFFELQLG